MLREEAEAAGAEAQRSRGEVVGIFSVHEVWLKFLFSEEVGGGVGALRQQAYCADRGLLGTFAFAAELESRNHVLP